MVVGGFQSYSFVVKDIGARILGLVGCDEDVTGGELGLVAVLDFEDGREDIGPLRPAKVKIGSLKGGMACSASSRSTHRFIERHRILCDSAEDI